MVCVLEEGKAYVHTGKKCSSSFRGHPLAILFIVYSFI